MTINSTAQKPPSTETGRSVILIASVAALAGFLFGYDSAVINAATEAIRSQFDVGPGPLGFAVASALVGAAIGALRGDRSPIASDASPS